MRIYLEQTDYRDYNDYSESNYPIENIKKQYDIYCKQNMYFDTDTCMIFCNRKKISEYSNYSDIVETRKLLNQMSKKDLIKYCAEWEFSGFMLARQQYYLEGGKITGY